MDKELKKILTEKCELHITRAIKQFITGRTVSIHKVKRKDGTIIQRTGSTQWPIGEISRKFAKTACQKLL